MTWVCLKIPKCVKTSAECRIEDSNIAIKLKQDYAEAYTIRGIAYGKKGELDNAIENFNTAICTATGNSGHSLRQDCGIISIYLKGVSDGETQTKKLHSRV